jgi:S1-C subfamily serine protease
VLVVGGRALHFSDVAGQTFPQCAGSISEVDVVMWDGRRYTQLRTTAPAAPGDSGGPVLTTEGRLVGIATQNSQEFGGRWVSWAWMLPEAELREIINADRESRGRQGAGSGSAGAAIGGSGSLGTGGSDALR